jgi:oxalate decarboxylase
MKPTKKTKGGEVRVVDSKNFKVATTIATAMVTLQPGGLRELHWHSNADEWLFFYKGKGRMTVFASGARPHDGFSRRRRRLHPKNSAALHPEHRRRRTQIPRNVQQQFFQDLSLNEWLTDAPPELVMQHLNIEKATLDAMPKENYANLPAS